MSLLATVTSTYAGNPSCTIAASKATIAAGQQVVISVAATDADGDLRWIHIEQAVPNYGYYGTGDTGTETPPNNAAYDISSATNFTRNLTLTLSVPGTYTFRGLAADNNGSGWILSPTVVNVVVVGALVAPATETVLTGFDVLFTVTAPTAVSPTYQWKKNGTNISGATSATLLLSNVATSAAATYTVTVTSSGTPMSSNSGVLTVLDPTADTDGDGIPDLTETAAGTSSGSATNDTGNTQQQNIHRPTL